ncbi:MAG: FAD-dependent oxidoreductase [Steroidobacteraceae bacterium]
MRARAMSWGRWPCHEPSAVLSLSDRFAALPAHAPRPMLAYGNGRSYGDVCLNQGGTLLKTRSLDRFIAFDPVLGTLECESGVLLSEIIDLALPYGWFPPVTPGTALVTVGGAIANDVHGKNHHRAACFSSHLLEFELCRSDGTRMICSATQNRSWFEATVGGLGLTGLISRARLRLRRVPGPWFRGDSQRFTRLHEFFDLSRQSDGDYEYTVAWIDCAASETALGRGIFMRANHAPGDGVEPKRVAMHVPFTPPVPLVNRASLRLFNYLYYERASAVQNDALWHYRPFLYPLDSIMNWNMIYGPHGFFQYQCVVPERDAEASVHEILRRVSRSGVGSFLAVLKNFGTSAPVGMLSFARPGTTLALDFPNRGEVTLKLLESLDEITRAAGGAVYPAKDARMSPAAFQQYFPKWTRFTEFVDPKFSSSFWRRVTGVSV